MEKFYNESISNINHLFRPEDPMSEIEENAKMLLLEHAGVMDEDAETEWEKANQKRFEELIRDPNLNYVGRLIDASTCRETFDELKTKLYQ